MTMCDLSSKPMDLSPQVWLRDIDLQRLSDLQAAPPVPPCSAVDVNSKVLAHYPTCHSLMLWEQQSLPSALYVKPADRYNVFYRMTGSTQGVVQWREGVLDVRRCAVGELVVVPPGSAAYFRNFEPSTNLHLSFEPSLLHEVVRGSPIQPRLPNCFGLVDPITQHVLETLRDYLRRPGWGSPVMVEGLCQSLVVRLLENLGRSASGNLSGLSQKQLALLEPYLMEHLDGSASLAEMARLVDLDAFQFLRHFKASMGVPPMKHVMNLRMRRARERVTSSRLSLQAIAGELGFEDPSHFSRTFRKHWGISPRALRLQS